MSTRTMFSRPWSRDDAMDEWTTWGGRSRRVRVGSGPRRTAQSAVRPVAPGKRAAGFLLRWSLTRPGMCDCL